MISSVIVWFDALQYYNHNNTQNISNFMLFTALIYYLVASFIEI